MSSNLKLAPTRLLLPLAPIYSAAVALSNAAYSHHWLPARQLQNPVISVGNLSVGGAGKTPLVIRLAELLKARGFDVDVLSRGYGRRAGEAPALVVPEAQNAAASFGDEPVLIAEATGVPVYVAASRHAAGLLAEQRPASADSLQARLHLLDDGFQHRGLARSVDLVVLHRSDFTGLPLPAGRLREPLSALRRASVAVLRATDADLEQELHRRGFKLPVWHVTRTLALLPAAMAGPAVAFCGIAHPQEFFSAVTDAGAALAATCPFPDHHLYSDRDMKTLIATLRAAHAHLLLTTEKDLVRLTAAQRATLQQSASLHAVPLRARLLQEEDAMTRLLALAGLAAWQS